MSDWEDEAFEESANRGNAVTGPETGAFVDGAEWQRAQLRTNEGVERVAEAMFDENYAGAWDAAAEWMGEDCRIAARTAINALLGEAKHSTE